MVHAPKFLEKDRSGNLDARACVHLPCEAGQGMEEHSHWSQVPTRLTSQIGVPIGSATPHGRQPEHNWPRMVKESVFWRLCGWIGALNATDGRHA